VERCLACEAVLSRGDQVTQVLPFDTLYILFVENLAL
jgi:hypothetical protein